MFSCNIEGDVKLSHNAYAPVFIDLFVEVILKPTLTNVKLGVREAQLFMKDLVS